MTRTWVLLASCIVFLAAWGQTLAGNPPPKKQVSPFAEYAGVWTSAFEGKVWVRLQLALTGDGLSGSLMHARSIGLNDNGDVKSVSEAQSSETITEASLNPDGLVLTAKDPDTQETGRYLMRLVLPAKDAADLKMIGATMPPGMPKPKPWRLLKVGFAATNKVAAPRPR